MSVLQDVRDSDAGGLLIQQNFEEVERRFTGFTFNQTVPASTWSVNHNLGYRPSACSVWIGDQIWGVPVVHIDNNNLEVRFAANRSGVFRCA
jgi:hypothetical protein